MKKNILHKSVLPTVIVAIPAYNEEKNIERVLQSVFNQSHKNYKLLDIRVYSDGSTDNTVKVIKSKYKKVTVYDSKKNIGKNARINQIMKENIADILIQIDADTVVKNTRAFESLVKAFEKNENTGLVCAYHTANNPKQLGGKLAHFGFRVWDTARNNLGQNGIRYYCEGGLRAFSRKFTKEFRLPLNKHVGEDSYSFYYAVEHGYYVTVSKAAKVYIDLAENIPDYIKQMKRFLIDPKMVKNTFSNEFSVKYETMTAPKKIHALLIEFMKTPLLGLGYICLQSCVYLQMPFYKPPKIFKSITR